MTEINSADTLRHSPTQPLWQRLLQSWAERVVVGQLTLVFPRGRRLVIEGRQPGPAVTVEIHRPHLFWRTLAGGDLGLAESFMDADWSTADLPGLLALGLRSEEQAGFLIKLSSQLGRLKHLRLRPRTNTRAASVANVAYHYDLGNDFYSAWLDPTMTYSSGLFTAPSQSLVDAQKEKYRRIAEVLEISPGDRVLEIGCGWGGFAQYAASEIGCHVTGVTLSTEQAAYAQDRLQKAGLAERTDIRLQDYRDIRETYDKIVSIEMFEAVGEAHWPLFFRRLRDCLVPGGRAALQVITIADDCFPAYRRRVDFIQRHVFPGGILPSPTALTSAIGKAGLGLKDTHFFGASYATTLQLWNERFQSRWHDIAQMGFDERFRRLWTYYLAYCEVGFKAGRIDVGQFLIART